jgi:hypothetical protein
MELDQLKNIWQKESVPGKGSEQVLPMLSRRSNNPIARMKRNLLSELISIIVLYGFTIIYYALAFRGRMSEVSWFMIAIALFFFVYYYRKNKLLNEMECVSCKVKSNLQRQVNMLEKYIRFYLLAGTALIPLTILFFSIILYLKSPVLPSTVFFPGKGYPVWETCITWIVVILISTLLAFYLNKWYVRKLYGKHIQKLKELLAEMEEVI